MLWDLAISGIPVSVNSNSKGRKARWIETVRQVAVSILSGPEFPILTPVAVSITYFHEVPPLDVDNMIKPILDGLYPEIMLDDAQVQDVSASRRDLTSSLEFLNPSSQLAAALSLPGPFVHIQIGTPLRGEEILWIGDPK